MKYFHSISVNLLAITIYLLLYTDILQRRLGVYEYTYLSGLIFVIVISGLILKRRTPWFLFSWALLAPIVGSIIGYILLSVQFYLERGYFTKVSIEEWVFVSTISIYLLIELWVLSLLLFVVSLIDYFLKITRKAD